jgi:hypothetical protein
MGLAECFDTFGAKGANPRWSWSARSEDGKTVVLTLWKDGIRVQGQSVTYDSFDLEGSGEWQKRPGNRERIENLKWARDNCGGLFRVVITVAKDTAAIPRSIAECFPKPNLTMRLLDLNEQTGEFRAESISQA